MLHKISAIKNTRAIKLFVRNSILVFFLMIFSADKGYGQWVNSPEKNTLFVTNTYNPINISSVDDQKGGIFIFWEDNISGFQPEINFLHINGDGVISFRSDGKKVSVSEFQKNTPVCTPALPNSAYVIWREKSTFSDQLVAQRVSSTGALLWNQYGVPVYSNGEISDFAAASDNKGRLFTAFVPKQADTRGEYTLKVQVLSSEGKKIFPEAVSAVRSFNKKSSLSLLADGTGGVYIFWLETIDNFAVLHCRYMDAAGKVKWGNSPLVISAPRQTVFSYGTRLIGKDVYVNWQIHKTDKDIYHQIISSEGKELWQKYGLLVSQNKGNQTNAQALINDENILLTWTDDGPGDRNILIQKFNKKGEQLWKKNGVPVIKIKGDQFGQRILSDGKKGSIITWIDRRINELHGNIYAQRINENGKPVWDSTGVLIASSKNTEKSYISVIPDVTGGAIVVFKEKRSGKNEIFGQKIFNTGTFISQIVAFNTEMIGDSVKISWYSANENGPGTFSIERTTQSDTAAWKQIKLINSDGKSAAKYYEFADKPDVTGTIFYRIVHSDKTGTQPSDLSKILYLAEAKGFFVAQNSPNPFRDKTVISINLPEASDVKMEFFDSHLEKVKELEKSFSAGLNQVEFFASGLKPGIYFYKVYAGDNVEVKKMVITN